MTEPSSENLGDELARAQWLQFCFLPADANSACCAAMGISTIESERFALVSESCDICYRGPPEEEPDVYLLRFVPVPKMDYEKCNCRDPRRLHVYVADKHGKLQPCEALASSFKAVPRALLREWQPAGDRLLPPDQQFTLGRWMSRRFDRAVFPTKFDAAISRRRKQIRRILKQLDPLIVELRIAVMENTSEGRFDAVIYAIVNQAVARNGVDHKKIETLLAGLKSEIDQCSDISLRGEILALWASEVTLSRYNKTQLWDPERMSAAD